MVFVTFVFNICNSCNFWTICSVEKIPAVPESTSSTLFCDIRVITVNSSLAAAQRRQRSLERRESECDERRKRTFYQAFVCFKLFLFCFVFAVCCVVLFYLQIFGCCTPPRITVMTLTSLKKDGVDAFRSNWNFFKLCQWFKSHDNLTYKASTPIGF